MVRKSFQQRFDSSTVGLSIDDASLYNIVKQELCAAKMQSMMREFGGNYSFGHAWCQRFFRRHELVTRVATTKTRELPADFVAKKEMYISVAAQLINKYNIPPELVIGCDETSVFFVPRATRTKAKKGKKKVRVIGVGSDKAQITATLFITESGAVLKHQLIFAGKTNKCHPKHAMPPDCVFAHTPSHWQSPDTFLAAIERIVVDYKERVIHELGLPVEQVCCYCCQLCTTLASCVIRAGDSPQIGSALHSQR
jgi:hypothetical protein